MAIQLKVTTDELTSCASEITTQINTVEKNWKSLQQVIQNSKSYWEGDASDAHRKYLTEIQEDMETVIKRIKEHPTDLLQMADIYVDVETTAQETAEGLPDDVII